VLSVDEKSQIQALDRSQPGLPLKKERCGAMTHFTPTSASWINAVEGFFAKVTKRRLCSAASSTRWLPYRSHQPLPRRGKPEPETFPLEQGPGQDHRRGQTRAPSVRFAPLS
jgi:hypothetical protein